MIKVVIVDDSATARLALRRALDPEKSIILIGEATDGEQALKLTRRYKPDLVIMDVHLREENGIDVTKKIMSTNAVPILVMTGVNPHDQKLIFDAIDAGALEIRPKLPSADSPDYQEERLKLISLVKTLSQVPVVTRRRRKKVVPVPHTRSTPKEDKVLVRSGKRHSLVMIGASTGGPKVVQHILARLVVPFPAPIVIVQHISSGFAEGLAHWLTESTRHLVGVCRSEEKPAPGRVYLAPDERHLCYDSSSRLTAVDGPSKRYQRPSIDELFNSAASNLGADSIAVLLTGMGYDGVEGLSRLRRNGSLTIAQELSSCVVPSMPRGAIEADAVDLVLNPTEIAEILNRLTADH